MVVVVAVVKEVAEEEEHEDEVLTPLPMAVLVNKPPLLATSPAMSSLLVLP